MNTVTKVSTAKAEPVTPAGNPHYPLWITTPAGANIIVHNHQQHSAHMGQQYGPDAKLLEPEPPLLAESLSTEELELAEDAGIYGPDPTEIEPGEVGLDEDVKPVKRGPGRPRREVR